VSSMAKKNGVVSPPTRGLASPKKSRKKIRNNSVHLIESPPSVIQPHPEQSKEETAIVARVPPQMAEIISVPSPDVELVKNRRDVDGETLGEYVELQFNGVCTTLRHLLPLIAEMKRKFTLLPRGKQVDGTYKIIRGCRSFKEWVETKLRRSERAVYYLLGGGNPQNEKAKLERKAAKQRDEERRCNARYTITLTVEGTRLGVVTKKAKEAFGSDLTTVEKWEVPSSDGARWAKAIEEIKNAKSAIEVLRDEKQKTVNEPPEGSADTLDHQECVRGFERIINHLDSAASEADDVPIATRSH
jgi:hypothetical protein